MGGLVVPWILSRLDSAANANQSSNVKAFAKMLTSDHAEIIHDLWNKNTMLSPVVQAQLKANGTPVEMTQERLMVMDMDKDCVIFEERTEGVWTDLDLRGCQIDDRGATCLAVAL